jgi:calcineurin-like phosphoesterase family protein
MEHITSDLHFGHQNILKFCPATRPFENIDEMDEAMIAEWNASVRPDDIVYILGDISYREPSHTAKIFARLNGKKILIAGNHDEKALKQKCFRDCFEEIHNYLEIKRDKRKIVMFHYPIAEWNQMHRGSIHFYGHLHGNPSGLEGFRALDVGMDATGKVVVKLEDAINKALEGRIKQHHGD